MQDEIEATPGAAPVQLLGVNASGAESGNEQMVEGRDLPLLQDDAEQDVWHNWGVVWRDVIILDPAGEYAATYNLTEHDLDDADNYAELLTMLRELAG